MRALTVIGNTEDEKLHIAKGYSSFEAFLDRERVVWDWPDIGGRLIDEFR